MANGKNAIKRISVYLNSPEIVPYVQELPPYILNDGNTGGAIELTNGNFAWGHNTNSASSKMSTLISSDKNNTTTLTVSVQGPTSEHLPSTEVPALLNANVKVNPGEIVAVVGGVGSGKSALIKALLGELKPIVHGTIQQDQHGATKTVRRYGDIAYCSQEAWLPKGTIRDAILFGREYNEERYRDAIHVAGLDEDIVDDNNDDSQLDEISGNRKVKKKYSHPSSNNGSLRHDTDVGEGGSSLSGGQRQRVAIARTMYSVSEATGPKVYLFDDCLAALDAQVGATVFERLSTKLRQLNAATVFVTNNPNLPRRCDRVLLMGPVTPSSSSTSDNAGSTIIQEGTYDELIAAGHSIQRQVASDEDDHNVRGTKTGVLDHDASNSIAETYPPSVLDNALPIIDDHGNNDSTIHPALPNDTPGMVSVVTNRKKKITVIGGATNSTTDNSICVEPWCQTDVEGQVTMQNCPDYIAYHSESKTTTNPVTDEDNTESIIEYFEGTIRGVGNDTDGDTVTSTNDLNTDFDNGSSNTLSTVKESTEPSTSVSTTIPVKQSKKIVSADDTMSSGAVPLSAYVAYFKAVRSPLLVVAMLSAFLLSNGAQFFQQYTVAKWTEVGATSALVSSKYMSLLIKAACVVSVSLWVRSFLTMTVGVRASKTFHSRLLRSVFAAPMSFFDATPSGQLLSRFGKEIETIDRNVPDSIASVLFCLLQIILSMGALAGVVTPGMLVPLAIVSVLYVKAMSRFRPAARDMKRVETKTRSPIYTHFGEALRGSETIRSIRGASNNWSNQHRVLTDTNLRVYHTVKAFDRWLSTRLETLGNIVVFTTAIASVILTRTGALKAGSAGWGLTQSLSITGLMTWAVRCLTDLESHMLSVVRVQELSSDVDTMNSNDVNLQGLDGSQLKLISTKPSMPKELSAAGEALAPLLPKGMSTAVVPVVDSTAIVQDGWPWKGSVEFKNVSMKYTPDGPYVLRNVNLVVPAGTTLGVVGRTGSGKSSLLVALFRLVEIEAEPGSAKGSIAIDGIDIRSVSMKSLRESLAIIPQDPILFTGTIAYNLDATGRSTQQEMIEALEAASTSLAEQLLRSPNSKGLDTPILEGGKNLSLGQRQLVCLARALLRKSKILVLDEATSSVDAKTDQEVQDTIRREFVNKGVTVITVAHRLDTVLGYDKILVLGNGQVLEYGTPDELVDIPGGELRRLVLADRQNKEKGRAVQRPIPSKSNSTSVPSSDPVML